MSAVARSNVRARGPAALLLLALGACGGGEPRRERYDLVVVLVDTLRADRLGAYGYERPTSPAIDALAAEGIVFERCIAQSTWTKPTVASLLTGELPGEHGVHRYTSRLGEDATTLAETLREAGYRTAAFIGNDMVGDPNDGLGQGFEVYASELPYSEDLPYPRAEVVVDRALAWLDDEVVGGDAPFYLHVHLCDPHAPYAPPEPFRSRFDGGRRGAVDGYYPVQGEDPSPAALTPDDWAHLSDLYDGEVAYVDAQVGRLLDQLERRGLADDALIVLVADHGEEFGEHGDWMHNPAMYQEVVHVPLVLRPPARAGLPRGARVDALAMQVDLVPTVHDLFGLAPREGVSGSSLVARLLDPASAESAYAYSEVQQHGHVRRGIFAGDWKRIRAEAPVSEDLLFDLRADPDERADRFAEAPAALPVLDALLADVAARGETPSTVLFEVANLGDTRRSVELHVGADPRPVGLDTRALELEVVPPQRADGPVRSTLQDWGDGTELPTAALTLQLAPGESDRISVTFAEDTERFRWIVLSNGEPLPAGAVRLGADDVPRADPPFALAPDDPRLAGEPPGTLHPPGDLVARVWSVAAPPAADVPLDPARRARLEALGYVGDD